MADTKKEPAVEIPVEPTFPSNVTILPKGTVTTDTDKQFAPGGPMSQPKH